MNGMVQSMNPTPKKKGDKMKYKVFVSVGIIALMLFGAFTVLINTGTENVKAADDNGLVAYWDFDEGTGTILHDKSGNGNDGTIYGATWVDGVKGKALYFNRSRVDSVEIPSSESLKSIKHEFTFTSLVKLKEYPTNGDFGETIVMFEKPYNGSYGSENGFILFVSDRDYQYGISLNSGGGLRQDAVDMATVLNLNNWYFISLVGCPNGTIYLYINGKLSGRTSWAPPLLIDDLENMWLGIDIDYDSEKTDGLDGYLDEMRIYNRSLGADEINSLYQMYIPYMATNNNGLVAYWDFDEGSGDILHDKSGNGNDGTINGATWVDGVKGKALEFDGESDYVEVPDSPLLDLTGDFTLVAWVNEFSHAQHQPYENHILSKHEPDVNSDGSWRFSIWENDVPCFVTYPPYTDYQTRPHVSANTSLSINAWHFVALTYSKDGKYAFYVDGKMTGAGEINFEIENTAKDLFIGSENGEKNYFDGIIDEVRIYNRSLGADEIKQLYSDIGTPSTNKQNIPVIGWVVDWNVEKAIQTIENNPNKFSEISWFAYHLTPENTFTTKETEFNTVKDIAERYNIDLSVTLRDDKAKSGPFINDSDKRRIQEDEIIQIIKEGNIKKLIIDYENGMPAGLEYATFVSELKNKIVADSEITWSVEISVALTCDQTKSGYEQLIDLADRTIMMAYDEHYKPDDPGPIAEYSWVEEHIENAINANVPKEKLILGIPNYYYAWEKQSDGTYNFTSGTYDTLMNEYSESDIQWDFENRVPYIVDGDKQIWLENAKSTGEKAKLALEYGLSGIAFWYVGGEDPDTYENLDMVISTPSKPKLNSIEGGSGYVDINWNPPSYTGDSPIIGYKIYRGDQSGKEVYIGTTTDTHYKDTSVESGHTYYYYVTAVNSNGEGSRSIEKSGTPQNGGGGSTPGFEVAYFIGALFVSSAMLYYRRRKP